MASMKPRKSSLPPPKPRRSIDVGTQRGLSSRIVVGIVLAAAVVLAVVIAVVVGGGDDDGGDSSLASAPSGGCPADASGDDAADDDTDVTPAPFADGATTQPVAVAGDGLDPFTDQMISGEAEDTARCQLAPVVSGYGYDGNPITIDAAADGATLVVLLAHWCPHCNAEIPHLNEWRDSGDVPEDLNVVGVSTAVAPDRANYPPDEWLVRMNWQWPVLADTDEATAFEAYGGQYFPTAVLIGSDGRVLLRFSGEPTAEQIDAMVTSALAADPAAAGGAS